MNTDTQTHTLTHRPLALCTYTVVLHVLRMISMFSFHRRTCESTFMYLYFCLVCLTLKSAVGKLIPRLFSQDVEITFTNDAARWREVPLMSLDMLTQPDRSWVHQSHHGAHFWHYPNLDNPGCEWLCSCSVCLCEEHSERWCRSSKDRGREVTDDWHEVKMCWWDGWRIGCWGLTEATGAH